MERVAVVIVNANAGPLLAEALEHLARQTLRPTRVIVVDNGSTDGSLEGLEEVYPGVELIRLERNEGFAAANNVGVRGAHHCDWVALLNPDAFAQPTWLGELMGTAAANPAYTFFASRMVKASDPETLDASGDVYHVSGVAWQRGHGQPASRAPAAGEVFSAGAAAALYRRDAYLAVGGFDERFFCYYEDTDLGFRLRLAGHRCLYVPSAVVHHVGSAIARRESDFMLYHTHRNIVWTYAKDMPSPFVWLYLPEHVLINVLTLVAFAWQRRFRVVLRAKRDALRGLPAVVRERRSLQRQRVASARAVRAAMATGLQVLPTLTRRTRELRAAPATGSAAPPPSRPA